jgi:hypothetical protein
MADFNLITVNRTLFRRLFSKIQISQSHSYKGTPCWEWLGSLTENGYGGYSIAHIGYFSAHRLFYRLFVGEIPPNFQIDHLCRIRHCANPVHLEAVTAKVNNSRQVYIVRPRPPIKKFCINGHPLSGRNLAIYKNRHTTRRSCKRCHANREAIRRQRA